MNTSDFGSYEFIWMNTNTNITAQGMYIGAELIDDILIFYIINPAKKTVKAIKGYLLNHSISESINKDWFGYKENSDKYQVTIFQPNGETSQVFTDQFVIYIKNVDVKILEITMPYNYITTDK